MDVEELTQRAVLRLVERARKDPEAPPVSRAYLNKMAFNEAIDELRRRQRARALRDSRHGNGPLPVMPEDPEAHSMARELGRAILACLRELSRDRQHAATLMLLGHKNQAIAALAGWDEKKAENLVTRARANLRKCLKKKGYRP